MASYDDPIEVVDNTVKLTEVNGEYVVEGPSGRATGATPDEAFGRYFDQGVRQMNERIARAERGQGDN